MGQGQQHPRHSAISTVQLQYDTQQLCDLGGSGRLYRAAAGISVWQSWRCLWTRDNLIVTIPASSGLSEFANVNFTGWTIGGGLEWLALPNVSLFAEYEFIDFHAKSVTFTTPPGNVGAPDVITHSQKNVEALLAGVNVRCCDRALR